MKKRESRTQAVIAASILTVFVVIVLAQAYNKPLSAQANPSVAGHSVDEIDWTQTITKAMFSELCLGGVCLKAWPSFNDILPKTCTNGQILKYNAVTKLWYCAADTGIPVCAAGLIPKSNGVSWVCSADGTSASSCPSGQFVTGIAANGQVICATPSGGGGGGGTGTTWKTVVTTNYAGGTSNKAVCSATNYEVWQPNEYYTYTSVQTILYLKPTSSSNYYINEYVSNVGYLPEASTTRTGCVNGNSCAGIAAGSYCVNDVGTWRNSMWGISCHGTSQTCNCDHNDICSGCQVLKCS